MGCDNHPETLRLGSGPSGSVHYDAIAITARVDPHPLRFPLVVVVTDKIVNLSLAVLVGKQGSRCVLLVMTAEGVVLGRSDCQQTERKGEEGGEEILIWTHGGGSLIEGKRATGFGNRTNFR